MTLFETPIKICAGFSHIAALRSGRYDKWSVGGYSFLRRCYANNVKKKFFLKNLITS